MRPRGRGLIERLKRLPAFQNFRLCSRKLDPASFNHMMRQFVKVERNPVLDHLPNIEQVPDFRDIIEEVDIKRFDQGF